MAEPANGEPLTLRGALDTIAKLEDLEPGLHQRTEGVTWILWGLITAGIYFTFATFGQAYGDDAPAWMDWLWMPWVAAGVLATVALWRSANLSARLPASTRHGRREFLAFMLVYLLVMGGGFLLYSVLGGPPRLVEPGVFLLFIGVASFAVAAFTKPSLAARRMLMAVGALILAVVLALGTVVSYPTEDDAYRIQALAGVLAGGGGWYLGGLWLTLKG